MSKQTVYLDTHASTRVDDEVLAAMLPFFTEHYGNGHHKAGWKSASGMEIARNQVSRLIGARPTELIFTSGATEAINLGLFGLARVAPATRNHIVTQTTEHPAVLSCIDRLRRDGFDVNVLEVDQVGRVDLEELKDVVDEHTLVVSIMLANNEIGTVQPVEEIGALCRGAGAKFFCDFTQGLGWHGIDVDRMKVDLGSISSHKIHGPRGVGALFVRRRSSPVQVDPILFGGGQERGLRPGTSNIPGIVGFGKACELLESEPESLIRIRELRDRLQAHICGAIDGVKLNGCPTNRHPGNLNLSIPGVTGEDLLGALPEFVFSTGSACASGSGKPSHVIAALRMDDEARNGAFRIGIGKFNTGSEIDRVGAKIVEVATRLQKARARMLRPSAWSLQR
jgi:cysteine desulfurase